MSREPQVGCAAIMFCMVAAAMVGALIVALILL